MDRGYNKIMKTVQKFAGALVVVAAAGCAGSNSNGIGTTSPYGGDTLGTPQGQFQQQMVSSATAALQKGDAPEITKGENSLGFSLFQKLSKSDPKTNLCISPISVGSVMSMLYDGAAGDTRKQIGQALEVGKLSGDQINQANKDLQSVLTNLDPKKVDLSIANSVWADAATPLSSDFVQKDQQFYGAKTTTMDFKAPEAPAEINDWVKSSTHGKIPTIVDTIPAGARLYVIDAVYFNGTWQKPFDKNKTQPQTFNLGDGTMEQVPMMSQTGSFGYFTNGEASGVVLPYGSGRLEMDVILPPAGQTLANFEKKLGPGALAAWMKSVKPTSLQVTMPTFQFSFASNLNDVLKAAGVVSAFDPTNADFSGMLDKMAPAGTQKLYLSEVKHKTFIDVNELGTEAAAVTSGQISTMSTLLPGIKFTADHPFVYFIRDNVTGAILFVGSVQDPKETTEDGDPKKAATKS